MTKSFFISILLLGSFTFATAQGTIAPKLNQTQFRVTFLPLGISLEQKLASKQSLNISGGLQMAYYAYSDTYAGSGSEFFVSPFINGELRNYYNRKEVKKQLEANSGNYVALAAGYSGKRMGDNSEAIFINSTENSFFIGPVWGIQRNYKTGFHLNLSIGMGYVDGEYLDSSVTFIGTGGIGFFFR